MSDGFRARYREARFVQYHAVVDRFPVTPVLDPIAVTFFAATFAVTILLALRRPSYAIALLLGVIPFAFTHAAFGTTITLSKVVTAGMIAGLANGRLRPAFFEIPSRRILIAFGLLVAAVALTAIPAEARVPVLRECVKWCGYAAMFAAVVSARYADPDDRAPSAAWSAVAAAVCVSALAQELIGAPWGLRAGAGIVPRISGALEGPNQLAGFLEVAIAANAARAMTRGGRATAFALALCGVTIVLTFSRAGTFAALVAVAILAWLHRDKIRALAPLAVGLAAGAGAAVLWTIFPSREFVPSASQYAGGVGDRAALWRAAWFFFRRSPVLGIGAGNFELSLSRAGLYGVRTHANSWPLQALAEGGVALFGATLWFVVETLRAAYASIRSSWWGCAAFAASVALVAHQFVDYLVFYPKVAEPWIVLTALACASARPRS